MRAVAWADDIARSAISQPLTCQCLTKLCGVDLRPDRFMDGEVAQTPVARLNSVIVRADLGTVPVFHILGDSASAEYYWDALIDAMAEFEGRLVGLTALRILAGG